MQIAGWHVASSGAAAAAHLLLQLLPICLTQPLFG
jgi:hypothetical protein